MQLEINKNYEIKTQKNLQGIWKWGFVHNLWLFSKSCVCFPFKSVDLMAGRICFGKDKPKTFKNRLIGSFDCIVSQSKCSMIIRNEWWNWFFFFDDRRKLLLISVSFFCLYIDEKIRLISKNPLHIIPLKNLRSSRESACQDNTRRSNFEINDTSYDWRIHIHKPRNTYRKTNETNPSGLKTKATTTIQQKILLRTITKSSSNVIRRCSSHSICIWWFRMRSISWSS